jgi:hypothetical protein
MLGMAALGALHDYAALNGAAPYRNRHVCVLLPIDAVQARRDGSR